MWNTTEKSEAMAKVDLAWSDISEVLREYNFDESKAGRKVNKALKHLSDEMIDTPAADSKTERPMTTIRVDTHGMDAAAVQAALDTYVQDAVDRNLQNKN